MVVLAQVVTTQIDYWEIIKHLQGMSLWLRARGEFLKPVSQTQSLVLHQRSLTSHRAPRAGS